VVRDLPLALSELGWSPTVLTPSYGMFHTLPGARQLPALDVQFGDSSERFAVYEVPGSAAGVRNIVFEHARFSPNGTGQIYSDDPQLRPFATDAGKFALFAAAAAQWIAHLAERPDVVHLHDWHSALYLLLRQFEPRFAGLRGIRTVFTIHNLSYQGTRPLRGDESSLEAWFPGLDYDPTVVADPAYDDCINPMATAIRLADRISTVSPTYAEEICRPSEPGQGFIGGEGLERLLAAARDSGRLVGILNGCFYDGAKGRRPGWQRLVHLVAEQLDGWPGSESHRIAAATLAGLPKRRPKHVLTSVGRLVRQKASLFFEQTSDGGSAIGQILDDLGHKGVLIVLGSGEQEFETQMLDMAKRHHNLLFLRGYSETLAEPLYRGGDLCLMPSSFEPCGISQMLAMRAMQPCVVHGVGGLLDTVVDERTGFVFDGTTTHSQADAFVAAVRRAIAVRTDAHDDWQKICIRAASARFSWRKSARATVEQLYDPH